MSVDNYPNLKLEIASWLNRDDLTDSIPTFITLAEFEISRVLRRTSRRATVTIFDESYLLPDYVAELRSLRFVTATRSRDVPLRIVTPEVLNEIKSRQSPSGRPIAASVVGNSLVFAPSPDGEYDMEMVYFARLNPLSDGQTNNDVLSEAPDAYLYGALEKASAFLEHDERVPLWAAKFAAALNQLEIVRSREEFGASLQPARLPVVF